MPLLGMSREMALNFGARIGKVVDIDLGGLGICLWQYLRVRVLIDISEPLFQYIALSIKLGDTSM